VIISAQGHTFRYDVKYREVCTIYLVLFFVFISSIQGHQSLFSHALLFFSSSLLSLFLSPIHSWASTERERKQKSLYFVLLFFLPSGRSLLMMLLLSAYVCV
jgi:hypothetical protein